ncbi:MULTISPECIES: glycoside hydrolase family 15 protein [unclassified Rathayibacter]|uniref:glycoside hydrolase family 15 protein n=1 Tax=unclassified Rathayibacter TaxID=2609250 RepID=UPI001048DE40|nr:MULTISPECIES: glycoside hydrolase family 15 protein [unclassified Rathayibacter]TCL81752.1 GH15 family glucan-1,4-alpha-glucosidase [Rathayibacter sp. PhB192]TCM26761.1 GH15 family glucan-1,4-alpha-glucosidase [Rathayibacter sp. PhB179]
MAQPRATRPLRDYAAIGDGRTVALIASDGSVDWLPVPDLGSTPAFAALIDARTGGCIELSPEEPAETTRRYLGDTNVLETTFTTESGTVTVTDALVTGIAGRLPWAELARRVECTDGEVRMRWVVRPGTGLGTFSPWIQNADGRSLIRAGDITIGVTGKDHGPVDESAPSGAGDELAGGFVATAGGERHVLVVSATHDEPLHFPVAVNVDRGIDRTLASWQSWSDEFSYDGPWAGAVQRSALALKLLIYSPTGAIAAAATTSLPESPNGGKNWDYRFAWVRDAAYTAHALVRFGLREETHAALSWLLRTIKEHGPDLHIFYGLDGSLPTEQTVYDVPGYAGIGPVLAGNGAQSQLQLGVFGDLFDICRIYVDEGNVLDIETGRLLARIADTTCDLWRNRDAGMWELEEEQHYTSSKMGCWQALDAAVHLAELGQVAGSPDRWRFERDRIRDWIEENCWSEELGSYVMYPGTEELDASVLLHAPSGYERGERMVSTIDALVKELGRGALLFRYSGMEAEEHPFVACSFWLAGALACVGRHDEAIALMDELVETVPNDVGIMSEMVAVDDLAFWGNLPQGLSHLALINAAITIEELAPEKVGER